MSDDKYTSCANCNARFYNLRGETHCDSCQKVATAAKVAAMDLKASQDSLHAMEIKKTLIITKAKRYWRQYSLIWFSCWTLAGGAWALYERYSGDNKGCVYRSAASILNPGFVLGCELLRERWEIGK